MKHRSLFRVFLLLLLPFILPPTLYAGLTGITADSLLWQVLDKKEYQLHYTVRDKVLIQQIDYYLQSGIRHTSQFFSHPFKSKFDVYIFPDRNTLNRQWQKDWGDSTFQSQCWMVASGVAHRLDILSPNAWANEACDHNANDTLEMRQVTWHELVHVFHGQYNTDHTFSYIEKLDWLVEGIATYISGQLNEKRLQRISLAVKDNKAPSTLDNFWKGNDKYGLSGSIVAYLDKVNGREKLFTLLIFTKKEEVLKLLGVSEKELIEEWKSSLK